MENKFCKCGCCQKIVFKAWHKYNGIPNYINGHNFNVDEFWDNRSTKKWTKEENEILKSVICKSKLEIRNALPNRTLGAIYQHSKKIGLKRKNNKWTKEEIGIVKMFYCNRSKDEIMNLLPNRTWKAIQLKASNLGIKRKYIKSFSMFTHIQVREILGKYRKGISIERLTKKYGVSTETIYRILKIKNIIRPKWIANRIYPLNINYFEKIDQEDKAYWLGFLFADGYINKRNGIILCLSAKDIKHLMKFRYVLGTAIPIHKYYRNDGREEVQLGLHCKVMGEQLIHYGFDNKDIIPNCIPDNLLSNFIRGFFDGDGSIFIRNINNKFYLYVSICGTISFLKELIKRMPFECNNKILKEKGIYKLNMGGLKAEWFLNWIYKNSCNKTRLERKYKIFIEWKEKINDLLKGKHRLTNIQTKEILNKYQKGKSGYDLAKEYNVSSNTIYYHLKKGNIPRCNMKLLNI